MRYLTHERTMIREEDIIQFFTERGYLTPESEIPAPKYSTKPEDFYSCGAVYKVDLLMQKREYSMPVTTSTGFTTEFYSDEPIPVNEWKHVDDTIYDCIFTCGDECFEVTKVVNSNEVDENIWIN